MKIGTLFVLEQIRRRVHGAYQVVLPAIVSAASAFISAEPMAKVVLRMV